MKDDGVLYSDAKTRARKFHLETIAQAYNPNRLVHVTAKDAIIDPHVTIRHENALPVRDPGYVPLTMQETFQRDATRRVITDYTGTPIIKVDQEGGIFDKQLAQGTYKSLRAGGGLSPEVIESSSARRLAANKSSS